MGDFTYPNLLSGTGTPQVDNPNYMVANYGPVKPLALGTAYTISYDVQKIECSGRDDLHIYAFVDNGYTGARRIKVPGPGHYSGTFILTGRNEDHRSDYIQLYNTTPGNIGTARKCSLSHVMLVEGSTPAAWAPAAGETLSGGGSSMSANLLAGYAPYLANGTVAGPASTWIPLVDLWTAQAYSAAATDHRDVIEHLTDKDNFPKLSKLTANQLVTISAGFLAASTSFKANLIHLFVRYTDAAGNRNWIHVYDSSSTITTGTWLRVSGTVTVPSGMTVSGCGIAQYGGAGKVYMTALTLSYGSGVPVAEETFTPFETASHAQTEYSTKASQKILSDSITSEVKARAKTDGAVSELSTKMEQTVNGINISLDKLTKTDQQIHSWFDFGTDPSGNPKLAMGSSSSPIIGEYSNTGTTYKDRSGATLLALDAANSTTGADHVVSNDVAIGKWKWVPTNGGDNLTLVWIGG